jgi:DNA repair protein RecO (recombination protein O)
MLYQTRGIAIHTVKFSETSIIVKIYTEAFGLQSYLVKGIRRQHSKVKPGLFQPLTILDLIVYHKEKRTLQAIKELHNHYPYKTVTIDIRKSSIALFINELVYKSVKEEESNTELFDFLYNSCIELDNVTENYSLFPLLFCIRLTKYLGFIPQVDDFPENEIFNMQDGLFQKQKPAHRYFIEPPLSLSLKMLLNEELHPVSSIQHPASVKLRNELLEQMLLYYKLHLPDFRDINSHRILHTVLA